MDNTTKTIWTTVLFLAAFATAACGEPSSDLAASAPRDVAAEVLYVLDPNGESATSRVLRLDTGSRTVQQSFPTGYDPAMALSPDGAELYVASARQHGVGDYRDRLTVIDTRSGATRLSVPVHDRWESAGLSSGRTMAVAPDGRRVYVLQARLTGGEGADYSVTTFDTTRGQFLPEGVPLGDCGAGVLLPSVHDGGARLQVVCPLSHDVRLVTVSPTGSAATADILELPRVDDGRTDANRNPLELWRLSSAAIAASGEELYAVTQNGRISIVDLASKEIAETVDLGLGMDYFIPIGHVEAGVGESLFLGRASVTSPEGGIDRLTATEVLFVDTDEWDLEGVVAPGHPFHALTPSKSQETVFAVATDRRAIMVIDARERRETSVIRDVGATPVQAEAASET